MGKDTTSKTIKTVTDSTLKTKTLIEQTITIEKSDKKETDYISKTFDLVSSLSWPLTIVIIILIFKKNFISLLTNISDKIRTSDSFTLGKEGIIVASGTTKEIPLDPKTNNTTDSNIFPDFPMTDDMSKKILSTLWVHQIEHDSTFKTRWTFTLGADSPNYSSFTSSIQRLQWLGIITYDQSSGQFFLTDLGIKYCETNKDTIGTFSFFRR